MRTPSHSHLRRPMAFIWNKLTADGVIEAENCLGSANQTVKEHMIFENRCLSLRILRLPRTHTAL